jgi:hypothetical protein
MKTFLIGWMMMGAAFAQGEWKPIFNGKDLTGWKGDARLWKVVDGVLTGESNDTDKLVKPNTFLIWEGGEPADFELKLKARVTGNNNSGVQYRSKKVDGVEFALAGYQMDMHPNQPYAGMLYEERGRGIMGERGSKVERADGKSTVTEKLEMPEVKLGEWNDFRVEVKGNVLRHYVNDKLALEIVDKEEAKRAMKGLIGLQLHAGPAMKAEFKEIEIKELK